LQRRLPCWLQKKVSIPHRKFKNDAVYLGVKWSTVFPSLIGSSKTLGNTTAASAPKMFPSLIGSSKTIKLYNIPLVSFAVSIPHRKFKNYRQKGRNEEGH